MKRCPTPGKETPPHLLKLADGRLCLTYGRRAKPYGIFAILSSDAGQTWSEPITLRDDGGGRDLGYPRSVQSPMGKSSPSTTSGMRRPVRKGIWTHQSGCQPAAESNMAGDAGRVRGRGTPKPRTRWRRASALLFLAALSAPPFALAAWSNASIGL